MDFDNSDLASAISKSIFKCSDVPCISNLGLGHFLARSTFMVSVLSILYILEVAISWNVSFGNSDLGSGTSKSISSLNFFVWDSSRSAYPAFWMWYAHILQGGRTEKYPRRWVAGNSPSAHLTIRWIPASSQFSNRRVTLQKATNYFNPRWVLTKAWSYDQLMGL